MYNDNPKSNWDVGDLLIVLRDHVICRASLEKTRTDCLLKTDAGKKIEEKSISSGTIVMALETQPFAGQLAYVRVLHEGNIWVLNSNFVKQCRDSNHVLL